MFRNRIIINLGDCMYSVYVDVKPCGTPFYVGKGNAKRVALLPRSKNRQHVNVCNKHPDWERLVLFDFLDEQTALDKEREVIAFFGRKDNGGILVNLTDGGDVTTGYNHTLDAKEKIRLTSVARMASQEARAKVSATFKGKVRRPRSEDERAKLSAANKGKVPTDETRAKLSAAGRGRKHSDETRAKLSAKAKGRMPSALCLKMSRISATGRIASPETRAKLSAARKGNTNAKGRIPHNKGVPCSAEMKARISATLTGRVGHKPTNETRLKLSASAKNRIISVETRAKISATLKARNLIAIQTSNN